MHRIVLFTFFVILGLVLGCGNKNSTAKANRSVLDVAPAPLPSAEPQLAALPINDTPSAVAFEAPRPQSAVAVSPVAASPKTYTVKKGDTLFSIAKTQLGSGRDWQKITAANPGLTPQKLKAGQQIAMP